MTHMPPVSTREQEQQAREAAQLQRRKAHKRRKKHRVWHLLAGAFDGDLKLVRRMIEKHGVPVDKGDANDTTALMFAAGGNHTRLMEWLLQNGAHVDHVDGRGETPLLMASRRSKFKAVRFLLANGSDVKAGYGDVPPLHAAAAHDELQLMELLLNEYEADVNDVSSSGTTPLMAAAGAGHLNAAEFLIQRGADVTKISKAQMWRGNSIFNTPLLAATQRKQLRLVQYLLSKGAKNWMDKMPKEEMKKIEMLVQKGMLNEAEQDLFGNWRRGLGAASVSLPAL